MEIGQFLDLEWREPTGRNLIKYRSKIVDKDENFVYMTYPVEENKKRTAYFPVGVHFQVSYMGKDESIYQFVAEIQGKRKEPIPVISIAIPGEEHLKRIQRRRFARIEIASDIAVHPIDKSFQPFTTVTTDFSGGGLAFIVPENMDIHRTAVNVWLALKTQQSMSYLKLKGEIVRIAHQENKRIYIASLAFNNLTSSEEQTIIRYCFEKQREARRKELT